MDTPLPFFPMVYPGGVYQPISVEHFAALISDELENPWESRTITVIGDRRMSLWTLADDLARRMGRRLVPVPSAPITMCLPSVVRRAFEKQPVLQQVLSFNRCLPESGDGTIVLPFDLGAPPPLADPI